MEYWLAGVVEREGDTFRAHVRWREHGVRRHIHGPRRPDEETAKGDLASMRAAANGKSREEGFAAMDVEAKWLREGKAPMEQGSVMPMEECHRARIQWREAGEMRYAYGPRRAEKRRAEEDLEALRETSSNHTDPAARRAALAAEAHRLQQMAEREVRVSIAARGLAQQQQPVSTAPKPQQLNNVLQHPRSFVPEGTPTSASCHPPTPRQGGIPSRSPPRTPP